MKKKSFFKKTIHWLNLLFAALLFLSIAAKYNSSNFFSFLSSLGLFVPFLIVINFLFLTYWLFESKKKVLISAIPIILSFLFFGPFYRFGTDDAVTSTSNNVLKVLTFNVRGFNYMKQMDKPNVDSLIINFLEVEDPDVICMQEVHHYTLKKSDVLKKYDYQYIDYIRGKRPKKVIQAIYSKYPILKIEDIDFFKSQNAAMYADLLIGQDTLRLFSLHLQSFKIIPEVSTIQNEDSKKLFGRLQNALVKQQQQAATIKKHLDSTPYPKLVVGDFNNTQFSNVYHTIKGSMSDTFLKRGSGFGKTYSLFNFPMRIDYILVDDNFEVVSHQNYDVELSDHYPVMATLQLKSKK